MNLQSPKKQKTPKKPKPERKRASKKKPLVIDDMIDTDESDVTHTSSNLEDKTLVELLPPYSSGLINNEFSLNSYVIDTNDDDNSDLSIYSSFLKGKSDTFIGNVVNRCGIVVRKGGQIF